MNTRLLTIEDLEQYSQLLNRDYFGKELKNSETIDRYLTLLKFSGEDSAVKVYGSFDNGQLVSSAAIHLWEKMKCYTLIYMMTHPKFLNQRFTKTFELSGLKDAMNAAIVDAESKENWQLYWVTQIRNYKLRKDTWFQQNEMLANRYNWYIEAVIPANSVPACPLHASLIHDSPRGVDLVIKTGRLKHEFIVNYYYDKKLVPFSYKDLYPNV
jgi:hypothetical protein